MSLQDQHLQQALKHAPDRDMVPNETTRATVLTYANNAVKRNHESWLKRIFSLLREWLGVSWHMTGVGSAVATVLVVVVFWHELPDDTMRKAATPSEEREVGATDSEMEGVQEAANAEKSLESTPSGTIAPVQVPSTKMAENKIVNDAPLSKTKSASLASSVNRDILASTDQSPLKNSGLAEAIPQIAALAPIEPENLIVAAPVPSPMIQDKAVVASAPIVAARPAGAASTATEGELAKEFQSENDANVRARNENIAAKKSGAKADVLGASEPKAVANPHENQPLLARIKHEGGKAVANQDIQSGNFRLLKIEVQSLDLDAVNCSKLMDKTIAVDAITGYKIESVGSCNAIDSSLKEVEVYNQTMRDWHGNHQK